MHDRKLEAKYVLLELLHIFRELRKDLGERKYLEICEVAPETLRTLNLISLEASVEA